jgi:outer membrane immunogenic protein
MKYVTALLVAGSAFAVAAPAMAQDTDGTFTGFRVEALGGYDVNQAGSSVDGESPNNDESIEGFGYGIGVGYDFNAGGVVLGVEGELADSTAETEFGDDGDFEGFGFGEVGAGRDLYVGARVGFLASPDLMVYGKGGYTAAKYDVLASDGTTELETDFNADGFRIGAGVEYALSGNTFAKVEYRYSNYSEAEIDLDDGDEVDLGEIDLDRHQVMAGFGFRF